LIELLIVILIIGILASLIVRGVSSALRKAEITRARALIEALDKGVTLYRDDRGAYPGRGAPADPEDPESNVIAAVVKVVVPKYCKINEADLGVWDEGDTMPRPATKEELDDPDVPKVVIDPWSQSIVARENDSKEKKRDWMHNDDGMDIYSLGPNTKDDTIELLEGKDNDDIGNW
jgi:type II secretory pathway pseudopilin PulG